MSDRVLLFSGLALAAGAVTYNLNKPKLNLPPSPPAYPFIGHLLAIPREYEYLGYMRMSEELGSKIISLQVPGTTMIILNKREDAINLFDKRSSTYSDRTVPPMVSDPSLFYWANLASLTGYGDRWRMFRRLVNPWLNKKATLGYQDSQTQEVHSFLRRLLTRQAEINSSEALEPELYVTIAATIMRTVYGHEVKSLDDRFLVGVQRVMSYLSKAILPSNYLVNVIPALVHIPDWFPGAAWKSEARAWRKEKDLLLDETYGVALDHIKSDHAEPIIIGNLKSQAIRLGQTEAEADEQVKEIAMGLLSGGTDTVVNTLMMFCIAMLLFPEVQKKAHDELDKVLGASRLPMLEDQGNLKYIGRMVKEILRWAPAGPLALPHTCFRDDVYLGYDIPKGALVFGNVWAMTRDPEVYKDPETFEPDRFLDPSVPPSPAFGWGRRHCPGSHFAESSLFLAIASMLMVFTIRPAQDGLGNDVKTTLRIANEMMLRPEPFKFRLELRSTQHEELVRSTL